MKQHLVKQHLLCLMTVVALTLAGGCAHRAKKAGGNSPVAVPANSFVRHWANDLKLVKDTAAQVHLTDDTIFLYTKGNTVYALSRSGGDLKYSSQPDISGGVIRAPLILGERVIYPCAATIEVYNNLGRRLRGIELEKPTRSGAVGLGSTIYIGLDHTGGTGVLASIDITRPYKVVNWELMTFGAVTPTPVMYDKVIFAGSEDGRLYAVNEERRQVWTLENGSGTFNTQGRFVSDLQVDDFGVYASNTDSKLYCLDRVTGKIKWQYFASTALKTSPVVTATLVYQFVDGTGIVAIDKTSGTFNRSPRWVVANAVQVLSEDQDHVYLRARDNRLMAVDKASGQVLFMSKKHPLTVFATNTRDSVIYGTAPDGRVVAIRPVLNEGEVGTMVMDWRAEPPQMENGKWQMANVN